MGSLHESTGDPVRPAQGARRGGVPVLAAGILLPMTYPGLPETVPTHFGVGGQPDGWGPKSSIFVVFGVLAVMMVGISVLSRFPRVFNDSVAVTEGNAQRVYRAGERLMVWLLGAIGVIVLGLTSASIEPDGIGMPIVWVGVALTILATVAGVVGTVRAGLAGGL